MQEELFVDDRAKRLKSWLIIAIAIVSSVALYYLLPYDTNANKGLALLLFVAIMWFSEAIHISMTAILVPVIAIFIGVGKSNADGSFTAFSIKQALANFSDPTIFLFFGGFALATALHMQSIDKKIAMKILSLSKSHLGVAIIAICIATAALSMWISNTATAAMMLPLVMGILSELDPKKDRNTFVFALLCVAYSASIGGLGTIVGSPPNAIASQALGFDFASWMKIGTPLMLMILPLMIIVLYFVFRPNLSQKINMQIEEIPWTRPRVVTLILFSVTALAWIFSKPLSKLTGIPFSDALIALSATAVIVVLHLATWEQISKGTDWGVLLLFGGGLALSSILKDSGASLILGKEVARIFGDFSTLGIIFVVCTFIIILTEFTSNTASAALLVPVFATIASNMGMPKEILVMVIGVGASCAFMLPVATPPNAIVFGTGHIRQKDMIKAGGYLNIGCVIIISLFVYFYF